MFSVWCYSDISGPITINSLTEAKAVILAPRYPEHVYFFAELGEGHVDG